MKKKILMLAVAACLIVLSIASSSLAYFTDTTEVKSDVFTSGKVDIDLVFNGVADGTKFFPGVTYDVPATVTVANDSGDAYVGAKIVFTTTNTGTDVAFPTDFVDAFGLTAVHTDTTNKTITVYVVNTNKMTAGSSGWEVLKKAAIKGDWDNNAMKVFQDLNVSVTAYAVQAVGFDNNTTAAEALAAAFNEWNFNTTNENT